MDPSFVPKFMLARQNPVEKPMPAATPENIQFSAKNQQRYNPFMVAMNTDSQEFKDVYGVNRPLNKPMFLGYRDDKALYGGSKLFILY